MVRRLKTRKNSKKRRTLVKRRKKGGFLNEHYVATSLEFEIPGRYPTTLSEEDIEEIKTKIGDYFSANKVPFTYYGTQNNYHIFTTLRSRSAYFNLSGGTLEHTPVSAGIFIDIELTLDSIVPEHLSPTDISNLKSKIRSMVKDNAQNLLYKGLFNNTHIFISDPAVVHGRQF